MRQDTLPNATSDPVDAVDAIVAEWRVQRHDLDPEAKHITGRVVRLAAQFQRAFGEAFAPLGLSDGDYGILAPLRRAGAPYELSPTDLARHRMITSGGLTSALDRLEHKGLISRRPNPDDRRGNLVRLTDAGLVAIDEAMTRHTEAEHQLVAALDSAEQAQLVALLRRLVRATD